MMPGLATEAAFLFEGAGTEDLNQFQPDPEGHDAPDDTQEAGTETAEAWVEWSDALDESIWASMELRLCGGGDA